MCVCEKAKVSVISVPGDFPLKINKYITRDLTSILLFLPVFPGESYLFFPSFPPPSGPFFLFGTE